MSDGIEHIEKGGVFKIIKILQKKKKMSKNSLILPLYRANSFPVVCFIKNPHLDEFVRKFPGQTNEGYCKGRDRACRKEMGGFIISKREKM